MSTGNNSERRKNQGAIRLFQPLNGPLDNDVTRLLENALEKAKTGEIQTIAIVAINKDFTVSTDRAGETENSRIGLLGGLANELLHGGKG